MTLGIIQKILPFNIVKIQTACLKFIHNTISTGQNKTSCCLTVSLQI